MTILRYSTFSVVFFVCAPPFSLGPFLGATPQRWKKTNWIFWKIILCWTWKKKKRKISKNKKARPTLKIFVTAIFNFFSVFVFFRTLPDSSGRLKITHRKQTNMIEKEKKIRWIPQEITILEPIQKKFLFRYIDNEIRNFLDRL